MFVLVEETISPYLLYVSLSHSAEGMENIQRDFLWGGGALEKKPHLVNWSSVCAYMRQGGLGIQSCSPK